ncbi:hypothetical protein DAPPUDRAFT_346356 [Daphnia pulex]|uniref:Uncharacterized protein n=1 Tax=Daphnia pulex TaxID=6669 RepID=E9I7V1_DAPPU|nr:hypothetical protein DAPPUDRAFT_346356 [Daphnia pulex]|eukprot:EFX59929.1 hypothetical protein DAPPUDRAFT_346356 [Daphnia pulex]
MGTERSRLDQFKFGVLRYTEKPTEPDVMGLIADRDTMIHIIKKQQHQLEMYEDECESMKKRLDEIRVVMDRLEQAFNKSVVENQETTEQLLHELIRVRWEEMQLKETVTEMVFGG